LVESTNVQPGKHYQRTPGRGSETTTPGSFEKKELQQRFEVKQDMERHGADYTLDKPLEQENLLAILDNVAKKNTPRLAVRM